MSDTHPAASAVASLIDGGRAIMSADGTEFRIVIVKSSSIATRMFSILIYAYVDSSSFPRFAHARSVSLTMCMNSTLMSLLGHVVLTLLIDGFNALANRSSRTRECAVQLEEGLGVEEDEVLASARDQDNGELSRPMMFHKGTKMSPSEPSEKLLLL